MKLGPEEWQVVSPYLDQALDLPTEERPAWLASLRQGNPQLADRLQALLDEHRALDQDNFLEQRPPTPRPDAGLAGRRIGAYTLISPIAQGGMGSVWLAERSDGRFQRRVAIKFILLALSGRAAEERFKREGTILGRLAHPHIAELIDAGVTPDGQPYLVLEHVEGEAIDAYCDRHLLDLEARTRLFLDVLAAVAHAHANLIVHRDLKPSNVLVRNDGQVKLLDFGIAKLMEEGSAQAAETALTQKAGGLFTPAYAAPEQLTGAPITTVTDVYALGVLFYVLLTGRHPSGDFSSEVELVNSILDKDPTRASDIVTSAKADPTLTTGNAAKRATTPDKLRRLLQGDLDTIIAKALEKDKDRRYASAAALANDIRRYLNDEPIIARPASASYQLAKFARRHKALVAGAVVVFVVLAAGTVVSTWQAVRARRAQREAERQSAIALAVSDFLQKDLLAQASPFNQSKPDPDMKLRAALDRAAQNIGGKFKDHPEVEAAIRSTIGETYSDLGLYPDSRKQLEKALELSRVSLGPDNLKTLQIMVSLGWLDQEQGRIEEAETLEKQALDGGRRALGATNPTTLMALRRLGGVYLQESKYPQAEATLSEALQSLKRINGSDNLDILAATNNLAAVYKQEGKFAQAEAMSRQGWDISKKLFGADSPQTLPSMGNLGILLNHVGKRSEAEAIDRQTLDIARRVLGPEHPNTLMAMDILAITCAEQGKYAEAESLNNQEFEIKRRVLGPDHPETLRALGNLGEDYALAGNYPRAEEFLSQAVEAEKRTVGLRSDLTLAHMNTLADAYAKDRQPAKAEQLDFQVFTKRRELLGAGNPDTLQSLNALVRDYKAEGKLAQADELLKQAHAPQPEKPAQAAQ